MDGLEGAHGRDLAEADHGLAGRVTGVVAIHEELVAVAHVVQDLEQVAAEEGVDVLQHGGG